MQQNPDQMQQNPDQNGGYPGNQQGAMFQQGGGFGAGNGGFLEYGAGGQPGGQQNGGMEGEEKNGAAMDNDLKNMLYQFLSNQKMVSLLS